MKKSLILIFVLISIFAAGQKVDSKRQLQVAGFIDKGKVLLRWSPINPISWQRGNKSGYSVYRRVVIRDGKVLDKIDSTFIGTFLPLPIDKWEHFADSSHFAVAAEAIYGKGFEVTTQSNNFFDMINKSREQDSRFSMGLLCADQSFTVACMMGLGLIDSTVKRNEAYLYKVVANYTDSTRRHEQGFAMVDFSYGNFLPRPFGINHSVSENNVTIMVPYEPFKGIYNSFELERSDDGVKYHTVKDRSYYSLSTTPDDPKYNIFTDSVVSQAATVYYRLKGRTSFDSYGPYSDTLSVKIMPSLGGEPWITDIREVGTSNLMLYWKTPDYKKENLKGYMIYTSKNYDGPYANYLKSPIEPDFEFAAITAPGGFAYFRVAALDQFNRPYFSAPRLYQATDSIPPLSPKGLTGSFDTTGVASLKWKYGKEKDLLCYQMLYSVDPKSEFSLVSKEFIYDSTYKATFPTTMLSSDMYFKVVALDTRYNTSKPSESLKLVKPDRIPPSPPLIFIDTDSAGVKRVSIAPSSSSDVKLHYLYFLSNAEKSEKIELFKGVIKSDTTFTLAGISGKGEVYCLVEDVSGRKGYSNRVPVNLTEVDSEPTFKALARSNVDNGVVEVLWDKRDITGSIMIYRKDDINGYNLIATVESQSGIFKDRNVTVNTNYSYKLVAFQKGGGAISRVIIVKYL